MLVAARTPNAVNHHAKRDRRGGSWPTSSNTVVACERSDSIEPGSAWRSFSNIHSVSQGIEVRTTIKVRAFVSAGDARDFSICSPETGESNSTRLSCRRILAVCRKNTPPGLPRWLAGLCNTSKTNWNEVVQSPDSTGASPVGCFNWQIKAPALKHDSLRDRST